MQKKKHYCSPAKSGISVRSEIEGVSVFVVRTICSGFHDIVSIIYDQEFPSILVLIFEAQSKWDQFLS